jgi:D-amino-acid dehydrogenase
MSERGRVIVIGGGVIGAASAYYLCRDGWQVTVLDQGSFGGGCSHGNCGLVCPSHVLPLAAPGAVRMALASLLQPDSAFRVKPRLDWRLWSWFWNFARRCNERDMLAAGRAIQALLDSSRRLYDELLRAEPLDCEWEARGLLFVFRTRAAMEHYAETDRYLGENFDLRAERHDGEAVRALEPALKPGLVGGWHYGTDAHLRPDRLMSSWRRVLEARGVVMRENCPLQGFASSGGRTRAVITPQGEFAADAFVVATGAWTPLLNRQLGCRVPIQPGKGYSITMPRPPRCPTLPLIFEEDRVAVTPMQSGYRIGSTMEFAGYDDTIDPRRLEILKHGASHFLQEPYCEPVEERWFGWRPMTYDGKPFIDRSPTLSNVLIAAGHNMLGLSMAPATGKLVAELLSAKPPHLDPTPFLLARK